MTGKGQAVAIVTGGASGIGKAVSSRLFEEGCSVVVCDIDREAVDSMERIDSGTGAEMTARYLDVSKSGKVREVFEKIYRKYGRIDILVHCAGRTSPAGPLVKKTDADFKRVIDVNLMGTFYCMREAASYMMRGGFGRIINIASRAGVYGLYGKCNYSASKAGMIGLSLTAAKELFEKGITVNVIAPAGVRTAFSGQMPGRRSPRSRPDKVLGEPEDVAHLVAFLAKKESYLINGTVTVLDGGGSLWHTMDERFSKMVKQTSSF
jgi:3-oxoacyl-[acyl-carrier protein] reductase